MLDDDPALLLNNVLDEERLDRYFAAKALSMDYYNKSEEENDTVYTSGGDVIAKKFSNFSGVKVGMFCFSGFLNSAFIPVNGLV